MVIAAQAYNPQVGVAPMAQPQVAMAVAMPLQQQQPQVAVAAGAQQAFSQARQRAAAPQWSLHEPLLSRVARLSAPGTG